MTLAFFLLSCAPAPEPTSIDNTPLNVLDDPWMEMSESPEILTRVIDGIDLEIKLKASYIIGGIVVTTRKYGGNWRARLAPYDVAIAWGELVKDNTYKKLKWSQKGRWYYWRHGDDFTHDNNFVARYSSNNHVIPATDNLKRALGIMRRGDEAELTGYLVDINGKKNSETYWWISSTSVTDTGDGSCEVLYLVKMKLGSSVYE
jgi:hypothetical protein